MELIAITPPYFYDGEATAIVRALSEGYSRVHLRKPGASPADMARLIGDIPMPMRQRISLHDCHGLAKSLGVGGLHLNSRNPRLPEGWDGIVSISTHSPAEAKAALANVSPAFDYIFISPVLHSLSKPGYGPEMTFEEMARLAGPRVVALGGVTYSDIPRLVKAGFDGAAMLTEAWRHPLDMDAFRLQFITHPSPAYNVVEGAYLALKGGCRWIQLRHKEAPIDELMAEGLVLAELCRCHNAVFIVDDHVELVEALNADGVHLGQNDMPVDQARRILGPSRIIGATANTFVQLQAAAKAGADYAGVGPFKFTTTKKNLSPVLGIDGYHDIVDRKLQAGLRLPIVAIGGITPDDIPGIMSTGVDGIAASSTILHSPDPVEATHHILNKLNHEGH